MNYILWPKPRECRSFPVGRRIAGSILTIIIGGAASAFLLSSEKSTVMSIRVQVRHFLELIRFSHTIFALPFAMLSAVIAWAQVDSIFRWQDLAGILICMVTAGGVRCRLSAARTKLRWRATSVKTLSWRKVTVFIKFL